jgi:hypothetical protein
MQRCSFHFFFRGQMDNHMNCRAHADLLRGLFSPILSHAQCIFVRVFFMLVHVNLVHKNVSNRLFGTCQLIFSINM